MSTNSSPLVGIRVLDFTENVSGPYATSILGDLGADVIKVEKLGSGDPCRAWGPFWGVAGCYFMDVNRNKRSISIDLKSDDGLRLARRLAERCDVVVENFRPGVMDRLGLGYDEIKTTNPGLIYCAISGFGEEGPRRDQPGFDPVLQALTGMMTTSGYEGEPYLRVGPSVIDKGSGMWAVIGVVSALHQRTQSGLGQRVGVSLLSTAMAWMSYDVLGYLATDQLPQRLGTSAPGSVPSQVFKTADGYVHLAVGSDRIWSRFCAAIDRDDLVEDPRFARNQDRLSNRTLLSGLLQDHLAQRTTEDLLAKLKENGIPSAPVNTVRESVVDEQVIALDLVRRAERDDGQEYGFVASPVQFGTTVTTYRAPPDRGQDTNEILEHELGISADEVERLRSEGMIE